MSDDKKAPQECPCGFFNDANHECICSPLQISRYLAKISGPLLDRIDLQIEVAALTPDEITSTTPGEPSSSIRERVESARQIQRERFRRSSAQCNAEMTSRQLRRWCELDASSRRLIEQAIARLGPSARAYDRVLKVARTIADLAATEHIDSAHVAEAVHYRALDRGYFRGEL
jgi:magnesium chelatase family protein